MLVVPLQGMQRVHLPATSTATGTMGSRPIAASALGA